MNTPLPIEAALDANYATLKSFFAKHRDFLKKTPPCYISAHNGGAPTVSYFAIGSNDLIASEFGNEGWTPSLIPQEVQKSVEGVTVRTYLDIPDKPEESATVCLISVKN